jgi:multiple sugar transport system substrate-binding protein
MKDHGRIKSFQSAKAGKGLFTLAVLVLIMLLGACGSNESDAGDAAKNEAIKNNGPVHLVFFSSAAWTQEAFDERFGAAMRKKFPNYEI